ncbi:von Willebrand factor [Roseimaritima multifibrata]|uniref:von Willebrand factor n=1 Tax=Roseimaritima multifibrata TaxID=1930274 RepID=A0A517MAE0_9BACT|nr:von Willebrand factor type A domain-containing protein [Roseimaritima multifibrata]QDS91848.1 von Willebrand factor [Roseimaritima multifibrata]
MSTRPFPRSQKILAGASVLMLLLAIGCGRSEPAKIATEGSPADSDLETQDYPSANVLNEPGMDAAGMAAPDEGTGAGQGGDKYDKITENAFQRVTDHPLSTFSIDVDTASYSKVRQFLLDHHRLPRPDSVRIEELVNYFDYQYEAPGKKADDPFATQVTLAKCPWNPEHYLARFAIKGREISNSKRPESNLVLLVDASGSMNAPNKLPLLQRGLRLLLGELGSKDRVAIVAYAGAAGLVLDSTPADQADTILNALSRLKAGGSTNGGEGLELAYKVAREHFAEEGTNRVILCSDGDFNVGRTGTDQMLDLVETESASGIELTVLGFGMGNFNDSMMEQISGRGNGNYAFIDTINEARKVLVQQLSGTLVTIAKDVKIQVEFNPQEVAAYRLIGYENRMLNSEDFNDDKKDAGEIGAGHTVTALYEIIPAGADTIADLPDAGPLKYQQPSEATSDAKSGELLTLKLRYKLPDSDESTLQEIAVSNQTSEFAACDTDFQFAAAVASFGMLLRNSPHAGEWTLSTVQEVAESALGEDPWGLRKEFIELVQTAQTLQ